MRGAGKEPKSVLVPTGVSDPLPSPVQRGDAATGMNRSKRHSLPTSFDILSLREGLIYHLVYHYSFALHVNHIVFLNLYLFGVFLCLTSFKSCIPLACVSGAYCLYSIVLTKGIAIPYGIFILVIALGALECTKRLDLEWYRSLGGGVGFILGSFFVQLLGHFFHEKFVAKPNIFHGFVAAPLMEYMSLLMRLNVLPRMRREIMGTVETMRAVAMETSGVFATPARGEMPKARLLSGN